MTYSKEVKAAALSTLVDSIMDIIASTGSQGIPEGHLYAGLMQIPNFRLEHLELILEILELKGKIKRQSHLVRAA